jgi:hypothetical protein
MFINKLDLLHCEMDTIFNFGDPHKDFVAIAYQELHDYSATSVPITNNRVFFSDEFQIVDASYGFAQVWDCLSMMKKTRMLEKRDNIIFLGSMGSLSSRINLDDLVIPAEVHYACFNGKDELVVPDQMLLGRLKKVLSQNNIKFITYKHGSVRAVFDPTTNHKEYENSLYNESVLGIDCSETYAGLKFCEINKLYSVALLYCSDDPVNKIADISKEEFDDRALKRDLELHEIAKEVFKSV